MVLVVSCSGSIAIVVAVVKSWDKKVQNSIEEVSGTIYPLKHSNLGLSTVSNPSQSFLCGGSYLQSLPKFNIER